MDLIVISDLHLSAGCHEEDGKYSCNEDFFFDEEFSRFLEHLQEADVGQKHLVIAGDLFDFLQVDGHHIDTLRQESKAPFRLTKKERRYGPGTESNKTVWKLGVIAEGHPLFFQAIARFLSQGHHLSILAGNHDIELYWDDVQRALVKHIVEKCNESDRAEVEKRIHFYPWCYYDAEHQTYIEHGNQYDALNSFPYLLYPLLDRDAKALWLPFGSFFVRYFFNKLEAGHPFADNIKPPTEYMRWALRHDKGRFLKNICQYLPLMVWLFLKGGGLAKRSDLQAQNEASIDELAHRLDLHAGGSRALREVYALMVPPFTRAWFANIFTYSTLFYIGLAIVLYVVLALPFGFGYGFVRSLWAFVVLLIPAIRGVLRRKKVRAWLEKSSAVPSIKAIVEYFRSDRLKESLPKIKARFDAAKIDVRTIVTGHTHDPDIATVDSTCKYFNTGTWTPVCCEEERSFRETAQFPFVWIKKVDGTSRARLLRWNDNLRRPQRVILLDER